MMSCCPAFVSEFTVQRHGPMVTEATVDYNHSCGFVEYQVQISPLYPFPSGQGALGCLVNQNWKEYVAVCLNSVFEAGKEYILRFHIGAVKIGPTCYVPINQFPSLNITLFGSPSCNMVSGTTQCPEFFGSSWVELSSVLYAPQDEWSVLDIVFTPQVDIQGIALGPGCIIPSHYQSPCWGYFLFDNFNLLEENDVPAEITLATDGESCSNDYFISASVNHSGGFWQWYFNGIAISSETNFRLFLANNQFQSGLYTARYSTPEGCVTEDIYIDIPPRDTTINEHVFCHGTTIICSGVEFNAPGTYEIILANYLGCDSVIQCVLSHYPISPETYIQIDTCGEIEIEVCGEIFSTSGNYIKQCRDQYGCDSTVILEMRTLAPMAIIEPPTILPCSPGAMITLDGSNSPVNPVNPVNTFYSWSTDADGEFFGPTDEPTVLVTRPGEYCLSITFEHNDFICSHYSCVIVEQDGSTPLSPLLTGPNRSCPDTILVFSLSQQGNIPVTGYSWIVPDSSLSLFPNDSTLLYRLNEQDSVYICGYVTNECGKSATVCQWVFAKESSEVTYFSFDCDSTQAGIFIDSLVNQEGCDSIIIRNISYAESNTTLLTLFSCDPALIGTDTLFFQNNYGCDSIVIRNSILLRTDTTMLTFFSCDSLMAGIDTLYLMNEYQCDSLVIIDTRYVSSFQQDTTIFLCGSGINFSDTILVSSGPCDSVFISHYSYIALDTVYELKNTCDPNLAGVFLSIFTNIYGCDSVLVHEVILQRSDTIELERITCNPMDIYSDTLQLFNQNGCDSLIITRPVYVENDTLFIERYSCDSSSIGVFHYVLPGVPCDTPAVLTTHWVAAIEEILYQHRCDSTGPFRDTTLFRTAAGCDSLVIRQYSYNNLLAQVTVVPERCPGNKDGALRFQHISGGNMPLQFSLNGSIWQTDSLFSNLSPGEYSLFVLDSLGCSRMYSGLIVSAGQIFTVDAGPDQVVSPGDLVSLLAVTSQPTSQLIWSGIDPISCATCPNTNLGPITMSQTVSISATNIDGCSSYDELMLTLKEVFSPNVFIPGSFTPNRDGINDYFTVFGNDQVLIVRNLSIYDRWGESLYSQDNLPLNDPNTGWDGSFRNKLMMPGVYIYVAVIEFKDGTRKLYKGEVTLLH
jgi:gliding motility-associated-like protein